MKPDKSGPSCQVQGVEEGGLPIKQEAVIPGCQYSIVLKGV